MNIVDERPQNSDVTKVVLLIGMVWLLAILATSFWWAMIAIHDNHLGLPASMAASVVYVALTLALAMGFNRLWRGVAEGCLTPAYLRRERRTMLSAGLYGVLLLGVVWLEKLHPVHGVLAYGLALLPAVPVIGMVAAIGLHFREETDEFERTVRIENALWATGATLAISTVWGFAEMLAGAPHIGSWLWFPVWALSGQVADIFTRRRYR